MSDQPLQRIEAPAVFPGGVDIQGLLEKATTAEAGIEVLERLMVMRREMRVEKAKEAFDLAMAAFQAECPTIGKDETVMDRKDPGKVRYRYAKLETIVGQVKEFLRKHGFSYKIDARVNGSQVTAICKVTHTAGHSDSSEFQVPIDPQAYMNEQQKFGSALTFAKRYAFCAAFGILTGDQDDDARAADPEHAAGSGNAKNAPGTTLSGERPASPPKPQNAPQAAKRPESTPHLTSAYPKTTYPTPAYREKAIAEITRGDVAAEKRFVEFLKAAGCILQTENLQDWPLQYVPSTKEELTEVTKSVMAFDGGDPAKFPFNHGPEPEPQVESKKPIEVPRDTTPEPEPTKAIDPSWEKVTGKIEHVTCKPGKKQNGQAYNKWGIKIGGEWHNSFSDTIGKLAEGAKGKEVDLYFSVDGYGKKAEAIEV